MLSLSPPQSSRGRWRCSASAWTPPSKDSPASSSSGGSPPSGPCPTPQSSGAQKAVAVSFFLLAPYVAVDAVVTLIGEHHASTSWVGIVLSIASLATMPWLGRAKRRLGDQLGSAATAGEGTQNLLCAYLAAGVLIGLLANTLLGVWWVDPAVALGIAALAVKEGCNARQGKDCC